MNRDLPGDQAQGLRRLFADRRADVRLVPVVANPHAVHPGAVLDRLCAAFAEQGRHVLMADTDHAASAHDAAALAGHVEALAPQLSYLAAGGLSLRHMDAQGSTGRFIQALRDAAPQADVLLVHASAPELCRLFAATRVRPLLLAGDHPAAVTHAYGALKLLATRAGLMSHDLVLTAAMHSPRIGRIVERLSRCADAYLGAALHDWAHLDPANSTQPCPALSRLVRAQWQAAPAAAAQRMPAALTPPPAVSTRIAATALAH